MIKNLYLDLETTGLNDWEHELYQIGAVYEVDGKVVGEFSGFCKPQNMKTVSSGALKVSNRTVLDLEQYGDARELFKNFIKFLLTHHKKNDPNNIRLIGYNIINFDVKFLKKFFTLNGFGEQTKLFRNLFGYQFVDLLHFNFFLKAIGIIPPHSRLNLDCMRIYYGVEIDHAHDALDDARSTYDIMKIIEKCLFRGPLDVDTASLPQPSQLFDYLTRIQSEQNDQ